MKKLINLFLTTVLSLVGINTALAESDGSPFAAENFSATLTLTTNYAFRGTSFSDRDPAIQGSFDWGHGTLFAGVWGSSTNPNDDNTVGGTLEIDLYAGWADNVGGLDLMIMPLLYTFPGQVGDNARDDTTFELWTAIGGSLESFPGSPYVNVEFNWSPEFFDNGDSSYYIRPSIALTLSDNLGLDFGYGYQSVGGKGGNDFFADDYSHIDVGITTSAVGFDLDLRYHNNFDEDVIGENFAFDNEIVLSIARSF